MTAQTSTAPRLPLLTFGLDDIRFNARDRGFGRLTHADAVLLHQTSGAQDKINPLQHRETRAHYVIQHTGRIVWLLDLTKNVGSTTHGDVNRRCIAIEIAGNLPKTHGGS